ncbi:MAG TPA: nuclear transport factor 2 family protein [Fimbriimonadaceae bacterium]|jgi:ketosteroid isomerase-like protein
MNVKALAIPSALLAITLIASAQNADKAQIKKQYAKLAVAMKAKDIATIEAMETKDYSEEAMGKTMARKESDEKMKQEFAAVKSIKSLDIEVLDLKIYGKTAIATSKYTMVATIAGGDGKMHTLKAQGKTTDNLVKANGGWLFKHEKDSGYKATLDGKTVKMHA